MRRLYLASAFAGGLDALLKFYFAQALTNNVRVFGSFPFDLSLHFNEGIAFNLAVPIGITALATILITLLLIPLLKEDQVAPYAFTAIVGILGNFFDRIVDGIVTDYLFFFTGSVFNLSDILILFGIFGVLLYAEYVKE